MEELKTFLQRQKILQIAPAAGDPWIANVLMSCETPQKLYFVGSSKTLYGQKLLEDSRLAFATAWHAAGNHLDRKGIQGVGRAVLTEDPDEIAKGIELHNRDYPEFKDNITVEWVKDKYPKAGVWVITPEYIKFWSDGDYGENESKEFKF